MPYFHILQKRLAHIFGLVRVGERQLTQTLSMSVVSLPMVCSPCDF